jgi:hypothetical protein
MAYDRWTTTYSSFHRPDKMLNICKTTSGLSRCSEYLGEIFESAILT